MKEKNGAHNNGCSICGEELLYNNTIASYTCILCGKKLESNIVCSEGHFICDKCHGDKAGLAVYNVCLNTDSNNPIETINSIMNIDGVHIHGPEHHYIVACSLLTAFCNSAGRKNEMEGFLHEAIKRGEQVPGGTCGFWGSCGASISAGIYMSIIMGVTPMSTDDYGIPSLMTADISRDIAKVGGPRCCKRNSYLSLLKAAERTKELTGIEMAVNDNKKCGFNHMNNECITTRCPFY